jgi:hypothetical protein
LRIAPTSALSIRPTRIRAMYSWAALTPSNAQLSQLPSESLSYVPELVQGKQQC